MSNTMNKIKALLNMHSEVKLMAEAKLVDGTAIGTDADAFADGVLVYVLGEDGEKMPLPSGAYELEDGKVIEVVDGEIASLKEAESSEAVEEEMSSDSVEEKATEEVVEEKTEIDLSNYITKEEFMSAVESLSNDFSAKLDALTSANKEELSKVKNLSAQKPFKHNPVQPKEKAKVEMSSLTSDQRIKAIFEKYKN